MTGTPASWFDPPYREPRLQTICEALDEIGYGATVPWAWRSGDSDTVFASKPGDPPGRFWMNFAVKYAGAAT